MICLPIVAKVARLDVISHLIDEQDFNEMQPVAPESWPGKATTRAAFHPHISPVSLHP
jgi:hypothetical protein